MMSPKPQDIWKIPFTPNKRAKIMEEKTPFYHWNDCPQPTRQQVECLIAHLRHICAQNLVGVYLHGSLALGCFIPSRSDLDILAVTQQPLSLFARKAVYQALLQVSNAPHPIEISLLCLQDLHPWRHPAPYDLHYSEAWRQRIQHELSTETWKTWTRAGQTDDDLAAHITILRYAGCRLDGQEIAAVFPPVPAQDYTASLLSEVQWVMQRWQEIPHYALLSLLRVLAFLQEGRILSKRDAGEWALQALPAEMQGVLQQCMAAYRGEAQPSSIPLPPLQTALEYLSAEIARTQTP